MTNNEEIITSNEGNDNYNRISIIGIIVEDQKATHRINELLSENSQYIVGRMGMPYREKNINIICVVIDASANVVSSLSGRLGMLRGVSTKTVVSKPYGSL